MIDLRQMRQFLAIADKGSFRAAAKFLNMSQPPLSVSIQKLEADLGVTLIDRQTRKLRLTDAGRVFEEESRATLQRAERALERTRRAGRGYYGELRVVFLSSVVHRLIPHALQAFRAEFPDVEVTLTEATTRQQMQALRDDMTDLSILMPPATFQTKWPRRILQSQAMVAALPEHHRLAGHSVIKLSDLAQDDWIMCPPQHGPGLHDSITEGCQQAGFSPRVTQQAHQMQSMLGLVSAGLGVTLVSQNLSNAVYSGVSFAQISGVGTPVNNSLEVLYRPNSVHAQAFADCLQAVE
jgi:DNA-binding transcriptional LysR family regulator